MVKHLAAILIVVLTSTLDSPSTLAGSGSPQTSGSDQKLKEKIVKLGVGEKVRVKVELRNKTEVKGYISETTETGFVLRDRRVNQDNALAYSEVKDVQRDSGRGWTITKWVLVGAGGFIVVGILIRRADART